MHPTKEALRAACEFYCRLRTEYTPSSAFAVAAYFLARKSPTISIHAAKAALLEELVAGGYICPNERGLTMCDDNDSDDLRAARGIARGLFYGLLLWATVLLVIWLGRTAA